MISLFLYCHLNFCKSDIIKEIPINPRIVIQQEAYEAKFGDLRLLEAIVECESNFDSKAVKINRNGTMDRGLWQWNDYWHSEISDKCAFDQRCSTKEAIKLIKNDGINQWVCYKKGLYKKYLN